MQYPRSSINPPAGEREREGFSSLATADSERTPRCGRRLALDGVSVGRTVARLLLRGSTRRVHTDAGHLLVGRGLSRLPPPLSLGEFERAPLRLVLARNVVERLALGRGLLADVPCPGQPDDVRGKDAYLEKSAGFAVSMPACRWWQRKRKMRKGAREERVKVPYNIKNAS